METSLCTPRFDTSSLTRFIACPCAVTLVNTDTSFPTCDAVLHAAPISEPRPPSQPTLATPQTDGKPPQGLCVNSLKRCGWQRVQTTDAARRRGRTAGHACRPRSGVRERMPVLCGWGRGLCGLWMGVTQGVDLNPLSLSQLRRKSSAPWRRLSQRQQRLS